MPFTTCVQHRDRARSHSICARTESIEQNGDLKIEACGIIRRTPAADPFMRRYSAQFLARHLKPAPICCAIFMRPKPACGILDLRFVSRRSRK